MKRKSSNQAAKAAPKAESLAILDDVLTQVPFDGWTAEALVRAAKARGLTPGHIAEIFPAGIADVIDLFGEETDAAMQARVDAEPGFSRFRVRDKIAFLVRARLEHQAPYREAVRRLMTWYALPFNIKRGFQRMSKTVDRIWIAAGDTSTDYNYYTKRILLAAVLKATILFWLDDETPNSRASWDFLDRRLGDVMKLGKSISLIKEFSPSEISDFIRRKIIRK